ncbi:MAG: asparaginase domain-containing protein [Alphaproteobacteria bacterium]|nr:asparaginase domain-containing protein [Alphaproteobacteria bacterium]
MSLTPKFDLEKIISTYTPPEPDSARAVSIETLIQVGEFINQPQYFALIGTGGTISSAYSPSKETIVPGRYKVAFRVLSSMKSAFGIISDQFTSTDLFAKDSRDITDADLILLLDFLHQIRCERVLITTGTYMLPHIAELLMRCQADTKKVIGLTGSMLPAGQNYSDASANILSAVTMINYRHTQNSSSLSRVFAVFHGMIFDTPKAARSMDLHPQNTNNNLIAYPVVWIPTQD